MEHNQCNMPKNNESPFMYIQFPMLLKSSFLQHVTEKMLIYEFNSS